MVLWGRRGGTRPGEGCPNIYEYIGEDISRIFLGIFPFRPSAYARLPVCSVPLAGDE